MASHSEYAGAVRGLSQTLGVAQGPVSASLGRDATINNLRHLHDECGQALATLTKTSGSYWTQASPSTSTLQRLDGFVWVEFPLHRRGDTGDSFLVIIDARVSISTAGTASFRFALHPGHEAIRGAPIAVGSAVADVTTTSTTEEGVAVPAIYLTSTALDASRKSFPSLLGDGNPGVGRMFVGALSVWAKASAGAPRLHSICAREYVGA